MLLVFQIVFSGPVISWIESIGAGRVVGGGGRKGSQRRAKATIETQAALLCLQFGT